MKKRLAFKIENIWNSWQNVIIIEDHYFNTNGYVTVGDFISDNFEINLGVKHDDPPSPFLLMYMWMKYA